MWFYKKVYKFIVTVLITAIVTGVTLSSSGCTDGKNTRIKSGKEITFFVASDTHYLGKSLSDGGKAFQEFVKSSDGRELNYLEEIMIAFANDVKKKKPEVLIISGDITNNGEKESHLEMARMLKKIEKEGTSVFVIPGNHDILNPNARGFKGNDQYKADYINSKDFAKIYKDFGYGEAISKDKSSLSYLAAPSEDLWLLMLDTAQYENNLNLGHPQMDGRLTEDTFKWIRKCSELATEKGARLIAVMHHNLIDHSEIVKEGYTLNNSKETVELFQQCGIELALSGHIHLQDIKSKVLNGSAIYDIATACLGIYPQKYGILKYSPADGLNYSTASVNVEDWAKDTGLSDKNLISFEEYSKKSFGDRFSARVISRLAITDEYTSEELQQMADIYSALNLRYYEGKKEVGTEEIKSSPGFKLWLNSETASSRRSVLRLSDADGEENNKLQIPNLKALK